MVRVSIDEAVCDSVTLAIALGAQTKRQVATKQARGVLGAIAPIL